MQQNIYDQLDPRPAPQPRVINGPPRLPSPQTPDQAALTAAQVAAARASTQHTQLESRKLLQDIGTGDGSTIPVRGNPNLTGEDYLKTLPPTDAAIVRAMAEGRQGLPAGYSMRSRQAMQLLAEAHQYDPTLDAVNLPARIATRKQYTSGTQSRNVVSLNTALGHLDSLARSTEALNNFDGVPVVNRALNAGRNAYLSNTGGPSAQPLSQFGIDQQAVINEMEKVFSGTGGTVSALKEWEGKINASKSTSELRAAIAEGARLLQSRLEALHDGYNAGMGTTDQELPFLNPHARATIDALQSREYMSGGYQAALQRAHGNGQPPAAGGGAAPPPGATPPGGGAPPAGPQAPFDPEGTGYIGFQGAPDPYQGKIVAINRQAQQAWVQDMLKIPRGRMSDEQLAGIMNQRWQQIDGRPLVNALDVARHYNQTGKISGADPYYQPTGDLKRQVDRDRADQNLISRQDISSARGQGGALESADALIRGGANAVTWGGADKLSAFLSPGDYQNNLARERAINQYDAQNQLPAQLIGSALGLIGNETGVMRAGRSIPMLRRVGEMIPAGARPALNDATYGAISGAVNSDGSPGDRARAAARMGVAGAAGGIAGRVAGRGAGRILTGARDEAVQRLSEAGVPLTIGQIAGRGGFLARNIVKPAEDALMSLPIIGSAIKARRMAGVEAFNRETFNQALEPIAATTNGQIGEQGVQSARDAVGSGYSGALNGVNVHFDDPVFARDLGRAIGQGQRLHPETAKDFETIVQNQLAPVIANGSMSGDEYQALQQAFGKERAAWKGQPRGNQYGNALRYVQGALESLVRRQAPDAVPALENANLANRLSKTVENAVERGANTGGVFTPAQLGLAARQSGRRFGNSAATPDRPFFDLQRAGQDVLPSQIPNSGTFDRAAWSALVPASLGVGGYELGMDPSQIAVMSALGLPFTKTGQAAFQKLLVERPDVVRNISKQMIGTRLGAGVNRGLFGAPAAAGAISYAGN